MENVVIMAIMTSKSGITNRLFFIGASSMSGLSQWN